MKIGIVLYAINNPGGILNHTEQLALGLRELGHDVSLISLENKDKPLRNKKPHGVEDSVFGIKFHPYMGWDLTGEMRLPYRGPMLAAAQRRLAEFDGLIWTIPVPRKRKDTKGDMDWMDLYNSCSRNVAVIHDGNLGGYYPHLVHVLGHFRALACVHPCALASTRDIRGNVQLVVNPFAPLEEIPGAQGRTAGWYSGQTFKGWKRVDNLVRASRYMSRDLLKILAGGGIEQCYMTSKDKIKEKYIHPDGERIWEAALANGMDYRGFVSGAERDAFLQSVTACVDPSYSKGYSKLGSHFNRTLIEAMRQGCVPVAEKAVTEHEGWLESGVHYVGIPEDTGPEEYADIVERACTTSGLVDQDAQRELMQRFDRKTIAQRYVNLLEADPQKWVFGRDTLSRANRLMEHFMDQS